MGEAPVFSPVTAGTNVEFAKAHNRRAIIEAVRRHGSLTRADLTRLTALSAQTISNLVAELEQSELLLAGDPIKAKRGQPARPYTLNPNGGYAIGFQMIQPATYAVLVNLGGEEVAFIEKRGVLESPESGTDTLISIIEELITENSIPRQRLFGIGVALPGPFGVGGSGGLGPGWDDFPLKQELETRTGLSVHLDNDANAAAISERLYGARRDLNNFVYLFISTGLGAGLFLNGQLYKGQQGIAGELGHIPVVPGGRPCGCGNRGCLERYLSLFALFEELEITDPAMRTPDYIECLMTARDPALIAWLDQAAVYLAQALTTIDAVFDPDTTIIGGTMPRTIVAALIERTNPLINQVRGRTGSLSERVTLGTIGISASARGAAAVPIFNEFNPEFATLLKSSNG
jgi:predicted NBD/HSP70 family sugar kinase